MTPPTHKPDLTKDGIHRNPKDWTVEDWRDLYEGINAIKTKIQARHRASPRIEERLKHEYVCMYCDGRAPGYKRIPDGPNEAGNWTHQYTTTMRTEDRVLCRASSIFARVLK